MFGTGQTRKLEEFVERAFALVGLEWQDHVVTDPGLFRPSDLAVGRANPSKAWNELGWRAKHSMDNVARMMVHAENNSDATI
ncbi:MAG: GDP-mannose 4,6-dehydratase [Gammaproteobacteria bacterium]